MCSSLIISFGFMFVYLFIYLNTYLNIHSFTYLFIYMFVCYCEYIELRDQRAPYVLLSPYEIQESNLACQAWLKILLIMESYC